MNILMAHWAWYPTGGDWTYVDGVNQLYESKGHQIIPFSVKNENNVPTPFDKYFLDPVQYKSFYKNISIKSGLITAIKSIYSIEAKQKLKLLLKENKVDIAQFNNISNYHTPSIIPVLKEYNIPIVWRILDYRLICPNSTLLSNDKICEACFKGKFYNCIIKKCKKKSFLASTLLALESYTYSILPYYDEVDMFLFQSEFTRDMFVKFGFDKSKTKIVENSFDFSNITPSYKSEDYILYFGRISKEKGIKTLLKAMINIPNIKLKIVGDGPQLEEYKSFIQNNKINNVDLLGPKWGSELDPLIQGCKFTIVPSEWYDPSPYVVLQSFAHGKPVLASNIGGLKDLIVDNQNGQLFEPKNHEQLSDKIKKLFSDKDKIIQLGIVARRILEEKNNSERYYSETMNVFKKLTENK
jgi:glycosyltransferase involved in cell wall biosynthesis